MYGIPTNLDVSFFSGKRVLQVCIGANEVILNFDDDVSITILSCFGYGESGGIAQRYEDFKKGAAATASLLDRTVVGAKGDTDGTLRLQFDNDSYLEVYEDKSPYESYHFRNGKKLYVV